MTRPVFMQKREMISLSGNRRWMDGWMEAGVPAERDTPGLKQILPHGGSIVCFNYEQKGDNHLLSVGSSMANCGS